MGKKLGMKNNKNFLAVIISVVIPVFVLVFIMQNGFELELTTNNNPFQNYQINTKCQFVYAQLQSQYAGKQTLSQKEVYSIEEMNEKIQEVVEKWGGKGYSGSWHNLPNGFWDEYYRITTMMKFENMGINPQLVDTVTDGKGAWISKTYTLTESDVDEDPKCAENIRKYYSNVVNLP